MSESATTIRVFELPRRYARAVFEIADSSGQLKEVADDFTKFVDIFDQVPMLRALSNNPFAERDRLDNLLQAVIEQVGASELFSKLVGVLSNRRRLSLIGEVAAAFEELMIAHNHQTEVEITSAEELSAAEQNKLVAALKESLGGELKVRSRIDSSLIGGVTVQIGSRLIDASIVSQLRKVREVAVRAQMLEVV